MSTPIGPGEPFDRLFERGDQYGASLPASFQSIYGGDWRLPEPPDGRPHVYLNFAVSRDGRISFDVPGHKGGGDISGFSRHDKWLMGLLRARADAIMVGAGTLRTARRHVWTAEQMFPSDAAAFAELRQAEARRPAALQVFLTSSGEIDGQAAAFQRPDLPTIVATSTNGALRARQALTDARHVEILEFGAERVDLVALARVLREQYGVHRLLCEGGGRVYGALLEAGLVDDEFVTLCPYVIGSPPEGPPRPALVDGVAFAPGAAPRLGLVAVRRVGDLLFLHSRYMH
jgi:riboflavin biosynthesis pyrimidine reductase